MNADQLIRKMGDSLGVFEDQSGVRRYPDLEQVLDKVIQQILHGG